MSSTEESLQTSLDLPPNQPEHYSPNRRILSPFRYPGGKYYAAKYILPYINSCKHDEYREPFVGGGSIFFAKKKCKYNWLNDLDSDLMTTYEVIASDTQRMK